MIQCTIKCEQAEEVWLQNFYCSLDTLHFLLFWSHMNMPVIVVTKYCELKLIPIGYLTAFSVSFKTNNVPLLFDNYCF